MQSNALQSNAMQSVLSYAMQRNAKKCAADQCRRYEGAAKYLFQPTEKGLNRSRMSLRNFLCWGPCGIVASTSPMSSLHTPSRKSAL
eukprot:4716667-Pyramimonas_sp.AAC.1